MSFSYSGNPSESELDAVRFLVQDTDADEHFLEDEELTYLISHWVPSHSVYWAASKAADIISAKFAREVTVNSDSQTVSTSELQAKYSQLAIELAQMHREYLAGGYVDVGGMLKDTWYYHDVKALAFGRGMHDDPEAGPQDYGGYDEPLVEDWKRT